MNVFDSNRVVLAKSRRKLDRHFWRGRRFRDAEKPQASADLVFSGFLAMPSHTHDSLVSQISYVTLFLGYVRQLWMNWFVWFLWLIKFRVNKVAFCTRSMQPGRHNEDRNTSDNIHVFRGFFNK